MSENRAICPDCGMQNVTVQNAPLKPSRLFCTNCEWKAVITPNEQQ